MGNMDVITKEYMRDNKVFADAINYLLYQGKKVVDPEKLEERDSTELAVLIGNDQKTSEKNKNDYLETQQKFRDILKKSVIMRDDKLTYLIMGIENQTDIHYAMPVRNMIYDALQYGKQVNETAARNRKNKNYVNKNEYLSGFTKNDKLIPVITLVIHFGVEPWDGPQSLHEMLEIGDKDILPYIQDYKIHLIDPARLTQKELDKFQSSLREVLGCIKYSKDRKQYERYITDNPRMPMDSMANRVVRSVTNIPATKYAKGKENDDMEICKAWKDMMDESKEEGRNEGRNEALVISSLLRKGKTPEEIAKLKNIDLETVLEIEKEILLLG